MAPLEVAANLAALFRYVRFHGFTLSPWKITSILSSAYIPVVSTSEQAASAKDVDLSDAHPPKERAFEAFEQVEKKIKEEIVKSREMWDKSEPRMWSRAFKASDAELVNFTIREDLVEVRAGSTSYGVIIFGKIRIPALTSEEAGEGFVHVRIHDPPNEGTRDVMFHSIFTDEGDRDEDGHAQRYQAIQSKDTPLEFFNE